MLRVGSVRPGIYSITSEGTDADVREQFPEVFSGIGKLVDFQLKLHMNHDVKPVAQPVHRLPFGLRDKVDEKLDELLEKEIGVQPSEEKVTAIRNVESLQNVSKVRSFLGLVQYLSKFLPDSMEVVEPLRKLMRTNQRFVWGTAQ